MAGNQVLDLFSCVGGHALGYTRAGFEPVLFVETRPERRKILERHWAVPVYEDIRFFWGRGVQADVVIGGPPCQKTSIAAAIHGKRTGESLWGEMRRVINECKSLEWVIVEQPPGNKEWEAQIQRDLEANGWAVEWVTISASQLGYPSIRRRRFAIANRDVQRLESTRQSIESTLAEYPRSSTARGAWLQSFPRTMRMADGVSRGLDRQRRIEAIGDSNPPEMVEVIFKAIRKDLP